MMRLIHFAGAAAATQLPSLSKLKSDIVKVAVAVTNEKAVLNLLVTSNATITTVTDDKLAKIEKHLLNIKTVRNTQVGSQAAAPAPDSRILGQLQATTKHKWAPGGFCSTHGWGVGASHTSTECKKMQAGHVDSATRANPQGPGATRNKAAVPLYLLLPPTKSSTTDGWITIPGTYTAPLSPKPKLSNPLSITPPLTSNPYSCISVPIPPPLQSTAQISNTAILDSGASGIYFTTDARVLHVNPSAPITRVGDAAVNCHQSYAQASHQLSTLPITKGNIMPTFKHNLFGIGQLCDNGCRVLFDTDKVTIFKRVDNSILLQGWHQPTGAKLWRFSLLSQDHPAPRNSTLPEPTALHAGDLPSVAITAGNYASWLGLTYANASKYCPDSTDTLKGHLTQTRQGLQSTKPKPAKPITPAVLAPAPAVHELHLFVEPISKLYTDDMGRFLTCSRSGNQYIMLAYHCDTNAILAETFQSCHDRHCIATHGRIMAWLQAKGHKVEHQIIHNKASADYRTAITQTWRATYQLVPPNVYQANAAEQPSKLLNLTS
eukprot:CCRYP_003216-RA/>CCRYP_003216-RA protein AED:0.27 eAED:0.13 QI:0/0/0/0.66/1/1/3/0/546